MTAAPRPAGASSPAVRLPGRSGRLLLGAGLVALVLSSALYLYLVKTRMTTWGLDPVDLQVYRQGGASVRHLAPWYRPHVGAPLYHWPGLANWFSFTYPPFAALVFTIVSLPNVHTMDGLAVGINVVAFLAAIWFTLSGLGYQRVSVRIGGTALAAAALFWIEPVQRVLYLGQIELVLLALIMWDLRQPDRRSWKGAGVGLAAGIKLVPLIFIPYLLLTRRFRQAAVATGAFAVTVVVGFVVLPGDSDEWWLHGLFEKGGRTGFIAWAGNQSLQAMITRFLGSVASATPVWLLLGALTAAFGLVCAAVLDRSGHRMLGLLTCALTGLLVSPISWDHHWVWMIPGIVTAAVYGARAIRRPAGWAALGLAALLALIFGAWPGQLWGELTDPGGFSRGLIWAPPNTNPIIYSQHGDRPWYAEYHWHGFQLIVGNLYGLTGIGLLALLAIIAIRVMRSPTRAGGQGTEHSGGADSDDVAAAQSVRLATPDA